MSASAATINELERSGLVERRKLEKDKRLNAFRLTCRGEEGQSIPRPDMTHLQEEMLAPMSSVERAILFELL